MLKTRIIQRIVLTYGESTATNFSFVQVKLDVKNQFFIGITNTGRMYFGNIAQNRISPILHLKASPTALRLFQKNGHNHALIGIHDGSLVHVNIDTKNVMGSHRGFGEAISDLDVHQWSDTALATYKFSSIIWNISKDDPIPVRRLTYQQEKSLIKAFFNANDDTIVTCFSDGDIILWDFPNLEYQTQLSTPLKDQSIIITHIAVAQNGNILLMLTSDRKLIFLKTTANDSVEMIELSDYTVNFQVVQMGMLMFGVVMFAVFLNERGNVQFFNLQKNRVVKELSSKSGKYINVEIPDLTNDSDTMLPIAISIDDGNLEILNVTLLNTNKKKNSNSTRKKLTTSKVDFNEPPVPTNQQDIQSANHSKSSQLPTDKIDQRSKIENKSTPIEFKSILQKFGEFPTKYRTLIWKTILKLPLNESVFTLLFKKQLHPAFVKLEETFPIEDSKLLTIFKKILSCLAYWCPLFGEVTYFPLLVFPFVKALMDTPLICFETILTYLVNWCQDWFHFYPAPPFSILAEMDFILNIMAPQLMIHLKNHQISARIYAWTLLESSFSDVFTKDEWFAIWDHIFAENHNSNFLYAVVVAYVLIAQNALLRCTSLDDFQRYFREKNPIPIKSVLEKAQEILLKLQKERKLSGHRFLPLPPDVYPQFSNYPLAVVENHAYQMQKIRKIEQDYLEQRKAVLQLEADYGSLTEMQEMMRQKEVILQAADYLQMQEVMHEERKLCSRRLRLQALKKEMESKELAILDAKKLQLMHDHQLRQQSHIKKMADTAHWMAIMRHDELDKVLDEVESMGFRQQADTSRFEIDLRQKEAEKSIRQNDVLHRHLQMKSDNLRPINSREQSSDNIQQPVNTKPNILSQKPDYEKESLEEKLRRLEDNNKNMEAEIKHMIDELQIGHYS